jgi:hypothetical protein
VKIKKLDFMAFVNRMVCFIDVANPDEVDQKVLASEVFESNKDQFKGYDYAIFYFRKSKKEKDTKPENSLAFILREESFEDLLLNDKYSGGKNGVSRKSKMAKANKFSLEG